MLKEDARGLVQNSRWSNGQFQRKGKEEEAGQSADPVPAARSQRVCAGQEGERRLVDHGAVTQGDEDGCSVMEKHVEFLEEPK